MNTNLPLPEMKLTPLGWPLMAEAYLGCVSWALDNDDIKRAFQEETGINLESIANAKGEARMIDEATGRTREAVAAFMDFVTRTVWGIEQEGKA